MLSGQIYLVVDNGINADSNAVPGEDFLRGDVERPSSQVDTAISVNAW